MDRPLYDSIYGDLIEHSEAFEGDKEEVKPKLYTQIDSFNNKQYFFTNINQKLTSMIVKNDMSNINELIDKIESSYCIKKQFPVDGGTCFIHMVDELSKGTEELDKLPPGFYNVKYSDQIGYFFSETKQSTGDKYVDLGGTFEDIKNTITKFYDKEDIYREHGMLHKMGVLLYGPPGCHQKGTEVIMIDGSTKKVEDVKVGDFLIGPDSKPREVLKLVRGRDEMVKVKPVKGEEFVINKNHILHLTPSGKNHTITTPISMKFSDYIKQSVCFQDKMKLTRTGIEYRPSYNATFDPYVLGLWLGDGCSRGSVIYTADIEIREYLVDFAKNNNLILNISKSRKNAPCEDLKFSNNYKGNCFLKTLQNNNLIKNKHIPKEFLYGTKVNRLKILAGLIDSDGSRSCNGYDIVQKSEQLSNDIVFLCRSLGFAAYKKECKKRCYNSSNRTHEGTYYRVTISGDLSEVPVILPRKKCTPRKQIKDVLRTGFSYEILPEDDYYGFTLSDDHLYLTSDFTIHHNCGKSMLLRELCKGFTKDSVVIFLEGEIPIELIKKLRYFPNNYIFVIEEITHTLEREGFAAILNFLDGEYSLDGQLVLATTNYPENLPENLASRPSRFDKVICVDNPNDETRRTYLESMLDRDDIDEIVKLTKDMSIAYLKEIIITSKINDEDIIKVIEDNRERIKVVKKQFAPSSNKSIGFN